ncbi:MAG: dgkA [Thermoleophilia bacterium]|jgi:diacylglycerol kinase (ATP)|nr:dgkA [Thermoleophilia bacterium]
MIRWIRGKVRDSRRYAGLHEARPLVQSFNFAFDGVIHVLATQRNMRIHFIAAAGAMFACLFFGVTGLELSMVIFAAAFVIISEMLNTAIEAAIDVSTTSFNPLAKVAKDVAAGAVLVATFAAVAVGYIVFAPKLGDPSRSLLLAVRDAPVHITFVALVLTLLSVIALKVVSGRAGTPLRGGWPSGHAAIAFAAWMAITFVTVGTTYGTLVAALTFMLALLVCHTRVEAGVHTPGEVLAGAVVGSAITLLVFQLFELAR